jgi:hypothetical protein
VPLWSRYSGMHNKLLGAREGYYVREARGYTSQNERDLLQSTTFNVKAIIDRLN